MADDSSLPFVREVKEVYWFEELDTLDHAGSFTIIAPDPMAGRKHRYSVIRIDYRTCKATCIGRELDLATARKVATRPAEERADPVRQQPVKSKAHGPVYYAWLRRMQRSSTPKDRLRHYPYGGTRWKPE